MSNEFKTVPEMQILAAKVPQAHDGEVVAWLHTVRDAKAREGDTDLALSFDDHSFPLDSIGWVSIKAQPFFTEPPRVVDVEVTQSMVTVGINVGNASVAKYLANAEKDNLTDKYTTDRIYMYAALKAALEKT